MAVLLPSHFGDPANARAMQPQSQLCFGDPETQSYATICMPSHCNVVGHFGEPGKAKVIQPYLCLATLESLNKQKLCSRIVSYT